jgi:integrase
MTGTGKRVRKIFSDEKVALKFAAKKRAEHGAGIRGASIPLLLATQAAEAERILEGTGVSIVEAARMASARVKSSGGSEPFKSRYDRAVIANEEHWSERYADDMGRIHRWVPAWFMDSPCGTIDRDLITRALTDGKKLFASTIDARTRMILAVVNFRERHRKTTEITILTLDQLNGLFTACENEEEKRAVAMLVYAGIRPDSEQGEIRRLDWEAVGKSEIYVSREVSKVGDRHVPILPALKRWIKGHPKDGPVAPGDWKRRWARIRKSAGISDLQDVCRHTFASHYLAAYGEDAAKQAMGHTAGSDTLFRHYRRAVTKADGVKFFK